MQSAPPSPVHFCHMCHSQRRYNPKRFSAVTIRLREPKSTALVFESGKMVITGAKSEDEALAAAKKYTRLIQRVGHPEATVVRTARTNDSCCAVFTLLAGILSRPQYARFLRRQLPHPP